MSVLDILTSSTSTNQSCSVSGDVLTGFGELDSSAYCDCSILKDVVSVILMGKRLDRLSPESTAVLGLLTGEMWSTVDTSNGTDSSSAGGAGLDSASHGLPSSTILATAPSAVCHVEHILWSIIMATSDTFYSAAAPPRAATAYCLRYYRRLLASAKWKVKSSSTYASEHAAGPSMFAGFSFSFPAKPVVLNQFDPDVEELLATVHLLSVVCRVVLLGYIAIGKREKTSSPFYRSETQVISFHQLIAALPPGTKSDIANLLLEAIDHCNRLFRKRFECLLLTSATNSDLSTHSKIPSLSLQSQSLHPSVSEFRNRYITSTAPVYPTMLLFNSISRQLPMPPSVADTLATIFSNTKGHW